MHAHHALLPSAALLAAGLFIASPASAALVTRCDGVASDVSVPGNLVVPAGASCELSRATIHGSVTVRDGADLVLSDTSVIEGDLTVAADAFAEVTGSSVTGSVVGRNPFSIVLETTDVGGDVSMRAIVGGFDATLYTTGSLVNGAVVTRGSEVFLESTTVVGDVDTRAGVLTDLDDSSVLGTLRVQGAELGSIVCESEIDGDAVFADNLYGVQIGGPGPSGSCTGDSYWGGALTVKHNVGDVIGIDVSNNIVRGLLDGAGNTPAPTGTGNRLRGGAGGQFADLQPAAPTDTARTAAAPGPDRRAESAAEIDARRVAAADSSAAAGAAFA